MQVSNAAQLVSRLCHLLRCGRALLLRLSFEGSFGDLWLILIGFSFDLAFDGDEQVAK